MNKKFENPDMFNGSDMFEDLNMPKALKLRLSKARKGPEFLYDVRDILMEYYGLESFDDITDLGELPSDYEGPSANDARVRNFINKLRVAGERFILVMIGKGLYRDVEHFYIFNQLSSACRMFRLLEDCSYADFDNNQYLDAAYTEAGEKFNRAIFAIANIKSVKDLDLEIDTEIFGQTNAKKHRIVDVVTNELQALHARLLRLISGDYQDNTTIFDKVFASAALIDIIIYQFIAEKSIADIEDILTCRESLMSDYARIIAICGEANRKQYDASEDVKYFVERNLRDSLAELFKAHNGDFEIDDDRIESDVDVDKAVSDNCYLALALSMFEDFSSKELGSGLYCMERHDEDEHPYFNLCDVAVSYLDDVKKAYTVLHDEEIEVENEGAIKYINEFKQHLNCIAFKCAIVTTSSAMSLPSGALRDYGDKIVNFMYEVSELFDGACSEFEKGTVYGSFFGSIERMLNLCSIKGGFFPDLNSDIEGEIYINANEGKGLAIEEIRGFSEHFERLCKMMELLPDGNNMSEIVIYNRYRCALRRI